MSGHLGNVKRTAQNLEIVRVDAERNLILVKGSVPGAKNGRLYVKPAVKSDASNTPYFPPAPAEPEAPAEEAQGEE